VARQRSINRVEQAMEQEASQSQSGEFEREPVPPRAQLGIKHFLGQYVGEHVAGTEIVIGPLFVAAGASARDLILGLLVGNALAVLSWMLLCAPIATRARLTLYYQLEKICGRKLVTLYNLANGVMFCILAGAMITVATTAVGLWFGVSMPALSDRYPTSVGWVVCAFCLGLMISFIAAYGYVAVARFANWAAPWMILVFAAYGIIGLRQYGVTSFGQFWHVASTEMLPGGDPLPGQVHFTFWHIMFFAWFCNMAVHIGMGDLSVFRFARKSWYAVSAASGMYVGHFMAWIAAAILYALQLRLTPHDTSVLPGPLSYRAAGVAGLIGVIVAGWTTANPTIYRAGLAFQAIMPNVSRFKVTIATGMLATIAGIFPAFAMKLLDFVAIYGLILMPMGAVIFVDFWFMDRLGLRKNYAEATGRSFNIAAAVAWLLTLGICVSLVLTKWTEIYFVSLPGWFIAVVCYAGVSMVMQRSDVRIMQPATAKGS
jgi:purine-cytosine permease-like protein